MNSKLHRKKGFSILEMLISLMVISFILLIFFNTIVTSLTLAYQNIGRSLVREESTTILNQITRDIRNADLVSQCESTLCTMVVNNLSITWTICDENSIPIDRPILESTDFICKIDNATSNVLYTMESKVRVKSLDFEFSTVTADGVAQNILVTFVTSHRSEGLEIGDVIRQGSISTRNYEI